MDLKPILARKRFIPEELIYLKDDIILKQEDNLIITKWRTLHPRKDIAAGTSAYYIDKGIKVSKVYDKDGRIVYWYCDIIKTRKEPGNNTIIFEDLLLDVILKEDGSVIIMDLDELAEALELKLITEAEAEYALRTLDSLLKIIYSGNFEALKAPVNEAE